MEFVRVPSCACVTSPSSRPDDPTRPTGITCSRSFSTPWLNKIVSSERTYVQTYVKVTLTFCRLGSNNDVLEVTLPFFLIAKTGFRKLIAVAIHVTMTNDRSIPFTYVPSCSVDAWKLWTGELIAWLGRKENMYKLQFTLPHINFTRGR